MIRNKYVSEYIRQHRDGEIQLNKERIMLIDYLEKHILTRDDLYFDETQIENFIRFAEKWYFPLQPFQKFLTAFIFLFNKADDTVFYEQHFWLMARGAGKNGFLSPLCNYFISPLHGIPRYNISIVANSEKQAKVSFNEVYDTVGAHKVLERMFYRTKLEITCEDTRSVFQFHTSNASTKDGLRDGAVVYDEIHQYENSDTVNVFSSGLGKVPNAREFFIGTDGFVRGGYLDTLKERAMNVLEGKELDDPLFPFICKIDEPAEVDDPSTWEKAQPMFHEPRSAYGKGLFKKVMTQYKQLKNNPSNRPEFMTKRMNYPETDMNTVIASWEDILATNRPIPDINGRPGIFGLDFASIKDFAAVGMLTKVGADYVWITHSFARKEFLDKAKLKPPIYEWEKRGLLTIVDEPTIGIKHIVDWFVKMRDLHGVNTVIADNFRLDLVRSSLEAEGFNVMHIRNPRAVHSLLAPKIETMFANHNIIFGDNPLMRWYCNGVYVHVKKDGNKEFLKKDEFRRKTDGFHAMLHALYKADEILEDEAEFFLADIKF